MKSTPQTRACFPQLPSGFFLLTALLLALHAAAVEMWPMSEPDEAVPLPELSFYVKRETLPRTLVATRLALRQWREEQARARPAVAWGVWQATELMPEPAPETLPPPDARQPDGRPLWRACPEWKPATLIPLGQGRREQAAVWLRNTLTAAGPVTRCVGLAGGDTLEVYLDGKLLKRYDTRIRLKRYGTGLRDEQRVQDQCFVDLPLAAGMHDLQLRLAQARINWSYPWHLTPFRFWFSPTPEPAPHLWQRVLRDYPRTTHALVDGVNHAWFGDAGWLAARDTRLEREYLAGVGQRHAPLAQALQARVAALDAGATPPDDPRWLELCVAAAEAERAWSDLDRLAPAVEKLGSEFPSVYPAGAYAARIGALRAKVAALAATDPEGRALAALREEVEALKRLALVQENPLLKGRELVFARRYTYDSQHYYDDYYAGLVKWGGNITAVELTTGRTRDLIDRKLEGGIFDRYDLSRDGKRIVFGYRPPRPDGYRLWEQNLDGSGLRQLTFPPADEAERVLKHSGYALAALQQDPRLYGHWTDDMHPCYLPDGRIAFVSSRSEVTVLCGGHSLTCTTLHRIDADGANLRQLSQGALTESTPTVMDDGRILYTRWEYVFKGIAAIQPLWSMRPDGTGSEEVYGDNIDNPGVFFAGRQIPGAPDKVVALGCSHEPLAVGSVRVIDRKKDRRAKEAMVSLTPEVETEGLMGLHQMRNGRRSEHDAYGPFFTDPFPLSESFFLVSHNPDRRYNDLRGYQLSLIDTFGNRVTVYQDPELSCFQPMLLEPRETPPILSRLCDETPEGRDKEATVTLVDLYRGLKGVKPGTIKYLRVLEQIPRSWVASQVSPGDTYPGQATAVSLSTHIWIAVLLGVVPVEADGSACFRVPARRNIFMQALDENYMQVQGMRTFVNFQPGETRSCIGCHDPRDGSQTPERPLALAKGASSLQPQPGDAGPRPLHYPSDVQPLLDKHCVRCHGGDAPKAGLDLRGTETEFFSASYENLLVKGAVSFLQEWICPPAGKRGPSHVGNGAMLHAEAKPPYALGSHASKLVRQLLKGHQGVKLEQAEFVRLATWVDANAQYYGSYYGKKNIRYKGAKDFRPVPTLESARGVKPCVPRPAALPAELLGVWKQGQGDVRLPEMFDGTAGVSGGVKGARQAVSVALRLRPEALRNEWTPLVFTDGGNRGAFH
jgi:hypothetical protein